METVKNRIKPNIELLLSRELKAAFRFLHKTRYLCEMSGTVLGRKHELPKGLSVHGQLCQGVPFTEHCYNGSNNSSLAS